jgi:cyanophycin synthetase
MLDYAHNKAGYEQLFKVCKRLEHKRLVGVIGMPGDRPDSAISEVGALCSDAFDVIYIKEDMDLRNRQKGEVAQLLKAAATKSQKYNSSDIFVHDNEVNALRAAMINAQEGDLIVVLYEKLRPLEDLLTNPSHINVPSFIYQYH